MILNLFQQSIALVGEYFTRFFIAQLHSIPCKFLLNIFKNIKIKCCVVRTFSTIEENSSQYEHKFFVPACYTLCHAFFSPSLPTKNIHSFLFLSALLLSLASFLFFLLPTYTTIHSLFDAIIFTLKSGVGAWLLLLVSLQLFYAQHTDYPSLLAFKLTFLLILLSTPYMHTQHNNPINCNQLLTMHACIHACRVERNAASLKYSLHFSYFFWPSSSSPIPSWSSFACLVWGERNPVYSLRNPIQFSQCSWKSVSSPLVHFHY